MLPLGWLLHRPSVSDIGTLLYLGIGTQLAFLRGIPWTTGRQTVGDPLLIAAGLFSPGFGVGLLTWLAIFDGRVPGKSHTWGGFFFNRALFSIAHVLPSVAVSSIGDLSVDWWAVPVRTAIYAVASVGINYFITANLYAFIERTSLWNTIAQNVGVSTLLATLVLSFAGGILYLLLQTKPFPVGYVIAPGLFGFVLAVRGNVADAQRQTLLKDQTLDLAAQALDARDRYTERHSIRVSEMAGRLGEHLELGDRECELIRTAGSLHDLGKIGVRDDILNKPGPLTEEEWEIMRRHPDIGADMIAQHSALAEVAPIVRHHHERWDGTGYPAGLKGDVIPFGARILAVADSYDTITGTRLYRPSLMTPIEGVEDISRRADHWYDPNVVDALRELHGLKPLEVVNRPDVPRRVTTLRVLRTNPGFSSLITSIGISALGDPLTQVATLVSIYLAIKDPRFVALAFIVQALGTVAISSIGGGLADRFPRRGLVIGLELARAAMLLATPFLIGAHSRWWLIYPILVFLACVNAIVQPARQAAIPNLVPAGQVGKANAIVAATSMLAGAIGFGVAGAILALSPTRSTPNMLFIADAMTFVLAAAIVFSIPNLGGGTSQASVSGALRRSWSIVAARPHLVIGTLAAFFIPISYPALLALAYQANIVGLKAAVNGGQTYSTLELVISVGIFVGSIVVARLSAIGTMRTVGAGLFLTGVFSVAIAMSSSLPMNPPVMWIGIALFIASIGNPIYAVANQTAILEAADPSNRGSVMATRFGLTQTATVIGAAAGGLITAAYSPLFAYGVLGVGLVLLAMYAIAAGRSTTNPLHGAAYEEATLRTAGAQSQVKT
ncbi:MAG TPA: MFS transporter [Candidatus Acidoferrum sp.]|jgi:putative nucleotidyltransferase with HDIG domain|nr:MFS transporter [Candidatus Acidoferrum sp.]